MSYFGVIVAEARAGPFIHLRHGIILLNISIAINYLFNITYRIRSFIASLLTCSAQMFGGIQDSVGFRVL